MGRAPPDEQQPPDHGRLRASSEDADCLNVEERIIQTLNGALYVNLTNFGAQIHELEQQDAVDVVTTEDRIEIVPNGVAGPDDE